jgi:hypothetical protein
LPEKEFAMSTFTRSAKAAVFACALFAAIRPEAFADSLAGQEYFTVGAGRYDLLRAHNERILVFFGSNITFKRYSLVALLNQYFTVASDVRGGVRYTVHEAAGEKTLVID